MYSYWTKGYRSKINYKKTPIIKSPADNGNGYLYLFLKQDIKQIRFYVHRLILETFVGPCPNGMQACHNDGNPFNNKLENLRWDTPENNEKDKIKHGTTSRGKLLTKRHKERISESKKGTISSVETKQKISLSNRGEGNGRAKLNELQVRVIKKLCEFKCLKHKEISAIFNVSTILINKISCGLSWGHI